MTEERLLQLETKLRHMAKTLKREVQLVPEIKANKKLTKALNFLRLTHTILRVTPTKIEVKNNNEKKMFSYRITKYSVIVSLDNGRKVFPL